MSARVLVISTGGTIAGHADAEGRSSPGATADELLSTVSTGTDGIDVHTLDAERVPSRAMTPAHMHRLARSVVTGIFEGYDGVVITHGTDTIEETAYALALQVPSEIPIVLTGAMRPPFAPGFDGPANLDAALRVAAARTEVDRIGPVVVMNDEIHAARWVTKAHTVASHAFSSGEHGIVGRVTEGRVRIDAIPEPRERDYLGLPDALDGRVELIWVVAGADGLLLDRAAEVANGIVVAGTGGGHMPTLMARSALAAVERGIPVVIASRCGSGRTLEVTYAGEGSETHLLEAGVLGAGDLSPIKARLRMLVALSLGLNVAEAFPV